MSFSFLENKNINLKNKNIDFIFFCIAVFLLGSAPFLSCLFFIYCLFRGIRKTKYTILADNFNKAFIFIILLFIFQGLHFTFKQDQEIYNWDYSLNWVSMVNWIPLFFCFIGFKPYVNNHHKRKIIAKIFIAGTIPILISCIGQYWFDWYGPFEILNGLIKWFQRPLSPNNQNVTGLFSNPNYAGAWLTMMWPLSISLMFEKIKMKKFFKSKIMIIINIILSVSIFLTNSRNAWIGYILPIPFLLGKKSLKWYFPTIFFTVVLIISSFHPYVPEEIRNLSQYLIPENVQNKFREIILNFNDYPRLNIWFSAIVFTLKKPLFGWGGSAFPFLYEIETDLKNSHAHNLFLELSVSYGLIISITLFFIFCILLVKSFNYIFIKNKDISIIDKSWWLSSFVFFFTHLYDILIFDIRINLVCWIFFTGLRNIIKENESKDELFKTQNLNITKTNFTKYP